MLFWCCLKKRKRNNTVQYQSGGAAGVLGAGTAGNRVDLADDDGADIEPKLEPYQDPHGYGHTGAILNQQQGGYSSTQQSSAVSPVHGGRAQGTQRYQNVSPYQRNTASTGNHDNRWEIESLATSAGMAGLGAGGAGIDSNHRNNTNFSLQPQQQQGYRNSAYSGIDDIESVHTETRYAPSVGRTGGSQYHDYMNPAPHVPHSLSAIQSESGGTDSTPTNPYGSGPASTSSPISSQPPQLAPIPPVAPLGGGWSSNRPLPAVPTSPQTFGTGGSRSEKTRSSYRVENRSPSPEFVRHQDGGSVSHGHGHGSVGEREVVDLPPMYEDVPNDRR